MATFHFNQQRKVTIWHNEYFSIEADTKEEAIAKVKEAWKQCCMSTGSEDLEEVMDDARFYDTEYMYDTVEDLPVKDNDYQATVEVYLANPKGRDYDIICDNTEEYQNCKTC